MERKLVQIGRSLAVTLPAEVVREHKLEKGQTVDVAVHPTTGAVVIRPGPRHVDGGRVTPRYRRAVRELLERRVALYRALAK
jgi:antitoxin component of MazEF toxin-antitoxin module